MKASLLKWFRFDRSWVFLPVLCTVLYVPQSLWGSYIFGDLAADTTSKIIALGLCTYVLSYKLMARMGGSSIFPSVGNGLPIIRSEIFFSSIYLLYLIFIVYVLITSEQIALLEALRGRSIDEIAFAREALFKSRVGWERSLAYLNAVFTSALIPFVIAVAYVRVRALRHVMLLLFCVTLTPSLEKALILKGLLPIVMLGFNGYFSVARAFKFGAAAIIVVALTFVVSKIGSVDYLTSSEKTVQIIESEIQQVKNNIRDNDALKGSTSSQEEGLKSAIYSKQLAQLNVERALQLDAMSPERVREKSALFSKQLAQLSRGRDYHMVAIAHFKKYNVFGSGQSKFIANRIFWIPYVTAYDWISYFDQKLDGRYLHGASSSLGAVIAGAEKFPMELEVFKFQFGGGERQTAAANANFWIDAFVNFGWLGVVLYSLVFAMTTFLLIRSNNPAALACYYFFVIQVSMGGMLGVLLSNGLLILVALAYLVPVSKDAPELRQGK